MPSKTARHNHVLVNMAVSLHVFLRRTDLGTAIPFTEFAFAGDTRLRPDVAVLFAAKWARIDLEKIPVAIPPDIAVEIVSPSDSAPQLDRKIHVYRTSGVAEVWVIYPDLKHLFVFGSGTPREFLESDTLASPLLPGWSLSVNEIFET